MHSAKNNSIINNLEAALLLLIILFPVWSVEWFHTGDMPAHLYCANVFNQLLCNGQSIFHNFFELNLRPVPNSIVQLLLSGFLLFFSPQLAVKIVTTIVIVIFCAGYFTLVRQLTGNKSSKPLLVFTIVFNFPLILGFYSFMLSIGMMMFCISFYLNARNVWNLKRFVTLSVLITITWFGHFFGFAAILLFIFIGELIIVLQELRRIVFKVLLKRIVALVLCALPALLFTLLFAQHATGAAIIKYLTTADLFKRLTDITVLLSYGSYIEKNNILFLKLLLSGIVIAGVRSKSLMVKGIYIKTLFGMLMACIILYFIMPYEFFAGGYINFRLMLLLLVFILATVDSIALSKTFSIIKSITILIICFWSTYSHTRAAMSYDFELKELYTTVKHIPQNTVLLPLNYSDNGLHYNFALYLSAVKNIVVLDNLEALSPNSLVRWKRADVFKNIGTYAFTNRPVFKIEKFEKDKWFTVDYLTRWHWKNSFNDTSTLFTNSEIGKWFEPVYISKDNRMELFKRKEGVINKAN